MKELDKWYDWFPGMNKESTEEKDNKLLNLVFYGVKVYSEVNDASPEIFTTVFTYHMGSILCTGHYLGDNIHIVESIKKVIIDNEKKVCKYCRLSEYLHASNTLIILDRREDV